MECLTSDFKAGRRSVGHVLELLQLSRVPLQIFADFCLQVGLHETNDAALELNRRLQYRILFEPLIYCTLHTLHLFLQREESGQISEKPSVNKDIAQKGNYW